MRSLKEKIQSLIEKGSLKEAREELNEYEKLANEDPSIYSIKGVICMLEGHRDEAERIFKKGLEVDSENFDILYNLGYIYSSIDKKELSITYYKRALKSAKNENDFNEIYEILKNSGVNEKSKDIAHMYMENSNSYEDIMLQSLEKALIDFKKFMIITKEEDRT